MKLNHKTYDAANLGHYCVTIFNSIFITHFRIKPVISLATSMVGCSSAGRQSLFFCSGC